MKIASAEIIESGSGQIFGLLSLEDSDQVVVFYRHLSGEWWGACQFGTHNSHSTMGKAFDEVAEILDRELWSHENL